ncbi:hypothetical protein [Mycobacterium sp.]|uniref:hypothetical protein n=1 Tax=Mycobacterium sp. TaxID=1785 RepID=UPI002613BD85|nr:hypothetical protein [Mycobacterium sp.]
MSRGLGRNVPPDWGHVEKYPLAALAAPPTIVPVVLGVNWYSAFDDPEKASDGHYWIARSGKLGSVRGGHCFCLQPAPNRAVPGKEQDNPVWWPFYNQGAEGSCVGHGTSRGMSLLNRKRYDAVWLYDQARKIDGDPNPDHEGSTVRAGFEILRTVGHRVARGTVTTHLSSSAKPSKAEGISAYRWATGAAAVLDALGTPGASFVTLLNSWGRDYPETVRMPVGVLDRLIAEDGEAGIVTDR